VEALDLGRDDILSLARNSIEATFLPGDEKAALLAELAASGGTPEWEWGEAPEPTQTERG
jgi:adenosine deaminase